MRTILIILLLTLAFASCEIQEDCYDCTVVVLNPQTNELDCLQVDCVTGNNLN